MNCWRKILYIFWNQHLYFPFSKIWWSPTFNKAKLQESENTRILRFFFVILGEEVLPETLNTMVPTVFEKNDLNRYLSHSQISKCLMLFLDSEMSPWTQILWEAIIFDSQQDALKVLRKFEHFGKSRNIIWVPPFTRRYWEHLYMSISFSFFIWVFFVWVWFWISLSNP